MSDEYPRVVDLAGQPVYLGEGSDPDIIDVLQRAISAANGEKYVAVAIVMQGEDGACWQGHQFTTGARLHALIGGLTTLKMRLAKVLFPDI